MTLYNLRAQTVQAVQWTGNNIEELIQTFGSDNIAHEVNDDNSIRVKTLDGYADVKLDWYVVREINEDRLIIISTRNFLSRKI